MQVPIAPPTLPPAVTPPTVSSPSSQIVNAPEGLPVGPLSPRAPFVTPNAKPNFRKCPKTMPVGGFCPEQSGSVPGGLPVNRREQKTLAQIKKELDKVLVGAGAAATTIAFFGSVVPHPAVQLGTKLGTGAVGLAIAVAKTISVYADPFDGDFRRIAEPQLGTGPQVLSPPASPRLASAVNALSTNSVQLREVTLALLTALNRAQSARQRRDTAAQAAQLAAAERFARAARALFLQRPELRRQVAAALGRNGVLNAGQIADGRRTINREGLPGDLESILAAFGAPPAWTEAYDDDVARSATGRRRVNARSLLTDDDIDDVERLTARYLDRLARFL